MMSTRKASKSTTRGLRHSGLPLGGLGTGSVELRSDGYFHEWQIMNNGPWGAGKEIDLPLDTAFFSLQAIGKGVNRSTILGLVPPYNRELNDPYALPWVEYPETIDAQTRMPFTQLRYSLPGAPVDVSLEAFSPFIPLDQKNSGLPLGYLTFTLKNVSKVPLRVALTGTLRNLVGYTDQTKLSKMSFTEQSHSSYIFMQREGTPVSDSSYGSMVLGAFSSGPTKHSHLLHPVSHRDLWEPLRTGAALENRDNGDFSGRIGNIGADHAARLRQGLPYGALCQTIELKAHQQQQVTFVLAWHFPAMTDRTDEWHNCKGKPIGHEYSNRFKSAAEVFTYGVEHFSSLRERTRAFFDAFYDGPFEPWLLEAVSSQMSTFVKASWWDSKERFGIWEGLGCCGLQTTDVTYYASFPVVLFFPELQKSSMRLTISNIITKGKIPHMMPGNFGCCDSDHNNRIDLIPEFILLVWRDVLWTGDLEYAREMWPVIRQSIAYALKAYDSDGDGLLNNKGPDQTYDQFPLKGTSAFVGFIFAASLKAAADIAGLLGEEKPAKEYGKQYANALALLEKQLWARKSYRLSYDPADKSDNKGVMADQINGDWFVRQTIGEGIIANAKVRSTLKEILKQCGQPTGYLANCAWPFGGEVKIGRHTADQANWPWSGVEYTLASHLVLAGMESEALAVANNVWERYERAGLRFNHIECGEHYYRAMSSWALYLSLIGFTYDALTAALSLAVRPGMKSYVFNTPAAWGTLSFDKKRNQLRITLHDGELSLAQLSFALSQAPASVRLSHNDEETTLKPRKFDGGILLKFKKKILVKAGEEVIVRLLKDKAKK